MVKKRRSCWGSPSRSRTAARSVAGRKRSKSTPPGIAIVGALSPPWLSDNSLREKLWENTDYFRKQLHALGVNTGESTSQVIPIIVGSDRLALYDLGHEMFEKGLFLAPVDYPSVPEDGLRFRVAVTAAHTRKDLDEALQIIEDTVVRRAKGA